MLSKLYPKSSRRTATKVSITNFDVDGISSHFRLKPRNTLNKELYYYQLKAWERQWVDPHFVKRENNLDKFKIIAVTPLLKMA